MRDKAAEEAEATAAAESLQMIYRSRLGDGHEEEDDSRTGATEQHSVATNGVTKAFLSVQDLIQAAIQAKGPNSCASLRQIYTFCENKTLLYKRSARSRLLSENKHYKSQIRHALYKAGRFVRNAENPDLWEVAQTFRQQVIERAPFVSARDASNATPVYGGDKMEASSPGLLVVRKKRPERGERSNGAGSPNIATASAQHNHAPLPAAKKHKGQLAEASAANTIELSSKHSEMQSSTTDYVALSVANTPTPSILDYNHL